MGAGRPGETGTIVPRSALRGRWEGEGSGPSGPIEALGRPGPLGRPHQQPSETRRGRGGGPRPGEDPEACAA